MLFYVTFVIVLVVSSLVNSTSLSDVGDIIQVTHTVVLDVLKVGHLVKPFAEKEGPDHIDFPIFKDKEKKVLSRMAEITNKVDNLERLVQSATSASMLNLKQDIPSQIRLELRIDTLLELVSLMNFADHNFKEYMGVDSLGENNTTRRNIEQHTLENFASYVVSHDPFSVLGILDRLHNIIHPDPGQGHAFLHTGILEQIRNVLQERENSLCHVQQSPHQIIFNLYNSLQMAQLKGYTMMQFSWMLLRLYKKGNFIVESMLFKNRYLQRMAEQAISLKEALKEADSAYWKCDPKHQVEGETYIQLTRLIQGYIQNEVDMNSEQSCSLSCSDYQNTKQYSCFDNQFCGKQRSCNGNILECRYIDSDMWVCQADSTVSKRRYDWIEYENGNILGRKKSCHRVSKVDSWWRWIFWHCSYCFCFCDDATNSDRYFSLQNVLSDTVNNKVVSGIRFVKLNGVVHMQIQEGTLGRFGQINETSWQPVNSFETKDTVEGMDYMKMSYYKRAIDLDDLIAPPEHVITGMKFQMVGSHLRLQLRATPFNFSSGQLIKFPARKDQWLNNDNMDGSRTKLDLDPPDNPLNSPLPSKIDSKSNQYLLFTHSRIDLDAAQTTVPFLDAQMVTPQPPVALSGIGLYHKGVTWSGGFIGLKVFTYNFGDHIEDSFPDLSNIETVK